MISQIRNFNHQKHWSTTINLSPWAHLELLQPQWKCLWNFPGTPFFTIFGKEQPPHLPRGRRNSGDGRTENPRRSQGGGNDKWPKYSQPDKSNGNPWNYQKCRETAYSGWFFQMITQQSCSWSKWGEKMSTLCSRILLDESVHRLIYTYRLSIYCR